MPSETSVVVIIVMLLLMVSLNVATFIHISGSQYCIFYLIPNLAISDLCFSVHLIRVLILNWTYDRTNTLTMDTWIKSRECHILPGILFVLILNSKTLCVLIVLKYMLITKYAFKTHLFSKEDNFPW